MNNPAYKDIVSARFNVNPYQFSQILGNTLEFVGMSEITTERKDDKLSYVIKAIFYNDKKVTINILGTGPRSGEDTWTYNNIKDEPWKDELEEIMGKISQDIKTYLKKPIVHADKEIDATYSRWKDAIDTAIPKFDIVKKSNKEFKIVVTDPHNNYDMDLKENFKKNYLKIILTIISLVLTISDIPFLVTKSITEGLNIKKLIHNIKDMKKEFEIIANHANNLKKQLRSFQEDVDIKGENFKNSYIEHYISWWGDITTKWNSLSDDRRKKIKTEITNKGWKPCTCGFYSKLQSPQICPHERVYTLGRFVLRPELKERFINLRDKYKMHRKRERTMQSEPGVPAKKKAVIAPSKDAGTGVFLLKQRNQELEEKLKNLASDYDSLFSLLGEKKKKIKQLEVEINTLQGKNDSLVKEKERLNQEHDKKISELQKELKKTREKLQSTKPKKKSKKEEGTDKERAAQNMVKLLTGHTTSPPSPTASPTPLAPPTTHTPSTPPIPPLPSRNESSNHSQSSVSGTYPELKLFVEIAENLGNDVCISRESAETLGVVEGDSVIISAPEKGFEEKRTVKINDRLFNFVIQIDENFDSNLGFNITELTVTPDTTFGTLHKELDEELNRLKSAFGKK